MAYFCSIKGRASEFIATLFLTTFSFPQSFYLVTPCHRECPLSQGYIILNGRNQADLKFRYKILVISRIALKTFSDLVVSSLDSSTFMILSSKSGRRNQYHPGESGNSFVHCMPFSPLIDSLWEFSLNLRIDLVWSSFYGHKLDIDIQRSPSHQRNEVFPQDL